MLCYACFSIWQTMHPRTWRPWTPLCSSGSSTCSWMMPSSYWMRLFRWDWWKLILNIQHMRTHLFLVLGTPIINCDVKITKLSFYFLFFCSTWVKLRFCSLSVTEGSGKAWPLMPEEKKSQACRCLDNWDASTTSCPMRLSAHWPSLPQVRQDKKKHF